MHDGDLISRSALLERMEQRYDEMNLRHMADIYQLGRLSGFKIAITEVENTPAVAAAPGWISVDDRLPEDNVDVLVWFEYFRYGSYNRLFQTHGISYMFNGEWSGFVNGESGWQQLRIIAWMPLPEPPITKE